MKIAAIDPSFSSTGLALVEFREDGKSRVLKHERVSASSKTVYKFGNVFKLADELAEQIINFASPDLWIIEVPVLETKSGCYLGMIQQALYHRWNAPVYLVPAQAINSYSKNKQRSKTYLVNFVKSHYTKLKGRINHDEASAIILANILYAYLQGSYKNTIVKLK